MQFIFNVNLQDSFATMLHSFRWNLVHFIRIINYSKQYFHLDSITYGSFGFLIIIEIQNISKMMQNGRKIFKLNNIQIIIQNFTFFDSVFLDENPFMDSKLCINYLATYYSHHFVMLLNSNDSAFKLEIDYLNADSIDTGTKCKRWMSQRSF